MVTMIATIAAITMAIMTQADTEWLGRLPKVFAVITWGTNGVWADREGDGVVVGVGTSVVVGSAMETKRKVQ